MGSLDFFPAPSDRPVSDFVDFASDPGIAVRSPLSPALFSPSTNATDRPAAPLPRPDDGWIRDAPRGFELLELARIVPDPEQPRRRLDPVELARLAESVRRRGILQAVRVQWMPDLGLWMLVAGERRVAAARAACLTHIPAVRADAALTDAEVLQEQLAENELRADLDPIERARAYRRLLVLAGWTQQQLCGACHLEASAVSRALKLLDLDAGVQEQVAAGRIVPAAAAELAKLPGDEQRRLAERIVAEGLTAAQAAALVGAKASKVPRAGGRPARQRTVIAIATGEVVVRASGGVIDNLRAAIAAYEVLQAPPLAA